MMHREREEFRNGLPLVNKPGLSSKLTQGLIDLFYVCSIQLLQFASQVDVLAVDRGSLGCC